MITRVLAVGLLAGLLAGLAVASLQAYTTTPIILEAEVFERGATAPQGSASLNTAPRLYRDIGEARVILVHDGETHSPAGEAAAEAWSPADGLERTFYTSTATIATAVGFALIILAGMLVAGDGIDERRAMAWAAAGFVATGLAPAVGLSPELPGMPAADLAGRQEWWALTAIATAAAAVAFSQVRQGRAAHPCRGAPGGAARLGRAASRGRGAQEQRAARARGTVRGHLACRPGNALAADRLLRRLLVAPHWRSRRKSAGAAMSSRSCRMTGSQVDVFVCVSCKGNADDASAPGHELVSALQKGLAAAGADGITAKGVECLAVCKRPCTLALAAAGKWTYIVGDLDPVRTRRTSSTWRSRSSARRTASSLGRSGRRHSARVSSPACRRWASCNQNRRSHDQRR